MLFKFLKNQKDLEKRKKLIRVMVLSLNIPDEQNQLYLKALDIIDKDYIEELYNNLVNFTENQELQEIENINKENFSIVAGMKKKEAVEKQKEINSFSFLISNL